MTAPNPRPASPAAPNDTLGRLFRAATAKVPLRTSILPVR